MCFSPENPFTGLAVCCIESIYSLTAIWLNAAFLVTMKLSPFRGSAAAPAMLLLQLIFQGCGNSTEKRVLPPQRGEITGIR